MRKFALFAVIIVLLASMATTVYAAPPPDGPPGLERAIAAQEAHTDRLLNIPGVVGTAVGFGDDGLPAVKIYTEEVGVAGLPTSLDGVPVEVVVTGRFYARDDPKDRHRPAPIGVSTGHPDITAGTIGARVTDGTNVYALSNNHVYACENNADIGDSALQPGSYDGGTDPDDKIGELYDFEPIKFDGSDNIMDAAIAVSSTDLLGNATLPDGYGVPGVDPVSASVEQNVQKYGRTTGLTHGTVNAINVTVDVCYEARGPFRCVKSARFVKQIAITPGTFSDGGDSGSLIVTDDDDRSPVGLLFAGSSTHTIANPIGPVLTRFNVAIDSEPTDAPTVSITSPADGSTFDSGATILFEGTASDTEDGDLTDSLVWTSDIDGQIGTGGSFSTTLSDGSHTITASVTDSGGKTGNDSVNVVVGNDAPTVSITSPADGSTFDSGATILFEGTASDTEDGDLTASLVWTSSIDDQIGTGGSFSTILSDGTHTITAEVTDSGGKTGNDSVNVVVGNDAPTVSITSPADGSTFDSGATILFEGTASDTEDGDLTASLVWTSDIDDQIGTGGSFSTILSDGTHTITAEVTDSSGNTGSASISITVGTPTEPTTVSVASITYDPEGGRNSDRHLLITVALVDDLGNPVADASVSIEVYLDGSLYGSGTGTTGTDGTVTFKVNNAPSGTYTTEVTDVTAAGLTWDRVTPENSFDK